MIILIILIILASLLEYTTHRWILHKKSGGQWYKCHTIEHHGKGLMKMEHTAYSWSAVIITIGITSPILLLCYWSWLTLLWILILVWIKYAHEAVHRTIHGEAWRLRAYILCPWTKWSIHNHLNHHKYPNKYFGELFPWTDYFFRTY